MNSATILIGDNRELMADLPEHHFHCCVTSPPYFGLRDYGGDSREIGKEATPDEFVAAMRAVFGGRDNPVGVWRVLRDDGVLWLNLGDSYNAHPGQRKSTDKAGVKQSTNAGSPAAPSRHVADCKPKDLIGIPWRVALALQADGWYLRDAIIWHKPAPMPGSQQDRCTSSYEFIFQLTKNARYFFDLEAIKQPCTAGDRGSSFIEGKTNGAHDNVGRGPRFGGSMAAEVGSRAYSGNEYIGLTHKTPRNVWKIAHEGFKGAHFATFPRELPTRCIKASTSERGCCSECGMPWARVTERSKVTRERPNDYTKRVGEDGTGNACANSTAGVSVKTTGWAVACKCDTAIEPCRVLDPFNGAGTTGIAANLLGRDYTGLELNPAYAEMARERIALAVRPSTARVESDEPAPLFKN